MSNTNEMQIILERMDMVSNDTRLFAGDIRRLMSKTIEVLEAPVFTLPLFRKFTFNSDDQVTNVDMRMLQSLLLQANKLGLDQKEIDTFEVSLAQEKGNPCVQFSMKWK